MIKTYKLNRMKNKQVKIIKKILIKILKIIRKIFKKKLNRIII